MGSLLRRRRGFRNLWVGGGISLVGDWLSFVAVGSMALEGGGALGLAVVFAAHALPAALVAPVAGAVVDRFDRRKLLIVADLLAAGLTLLMAGAAALGSVLGVQLLLLGRSAVTSLVPPAETAAVRGLVEPEELVRANGLLAATWSTAYVLGMAFGGVVALAGTVLALVLDAASFLAASAAHAALPALPVGPGRARTAVEVVRAVPADTRAALASAAGRPLLLRAVFAKTPVALATGTGWVALNLIAAAAQPFGSAALSFGVLQAVRGLGTGIGPAIAGRLLGRGVGESHLVAAAYALTFLSIPALALARSPVALLAVALAWGVGSGTNWVLSHSALQRYAADDVMGRLAAFDELSVTVAMVASCFLGAAAVKASGVGAAALGGLALGVIGMHGLRRLERAVARSASPTRPSAPWTSTK